MGHEVTVFTDVLYNLVFTPLRLSQTKENKFNPASIVVYV